MSFSSERSIIVADASALAALSSIRQTRLLQEQFDRVWIPPAVFRELVTDGEGWIQAAQAQRIVRDEEWIVMWTESIPKLARPPRGLALGEVEAIALASQLGAPILIDDQRGRRHAAALGLDVTGSWVFYGVPSFRAGSWR